MSYYYANSGEKRIPMKGDYVKCLVRHFEEYAYGDKATVLDVYKDVDNGNWKICLPNSGSPVGHTWYLAENWKLLTRVKEQNMAAYEKTKYFVAVVNEFESTPTFLVPDPSTIGPMRDTKSEALRDAETRIRADDAGKKLIILQTIALIQEEDPRPPIKITEYK